MYAPLFCSFGSHAWYFGCWTLLRRVGFGMIDILISSDKMFQFMAYTYMSMMALLVHSYIQPYTNRRLNALEYVSHLLLASISCLLIVYSAPYSDRINIALFLLIVPFCIVLLGTFIKAKHQEVIQSKNARKSLATSPSAASVSVVHDEEPRKRDSMHRMHKSEQSIEDLPTHSQTRDSVIEMQASAPPKNESIPSTRESAEGRSSWVNPRMVRIHLPPTERPETK